MYSVYLNRWKDWVIRKQKTQGLNVYSQEYKDELSCLIKLQGLSDN
jgi:hypothetical protein